MAMAFGERRKARPPLHVWLMAAALVLSAFLGASLGLVWQTSGLGGSDEEDAAEQSEAAAQAEAEAREADEEAEDAEADAPVLPGATSST